MHYRDDTIAAENAPTMIYLQIPNWATYSCRLFMRGPLANPLQVPDDSHLVLQRTLLCVN